MREKRSIPGLSGSKKSRISKRIQNSWKKKLGREGFCKEGKKKRGSDRLGAQKTGEVTKGSGKSKSCYGTGELRNVAGQGEETLV